MSQLRVHARQILAKCQFSSTVIRICKPVQIQQLSSCGVNLAIFHTWENPFSTLNGSPGGFGVLFSRFTSEQKADGKSNDMNSENNSGSREPRTGSLLELGIMLVALFLSGAAGIINQVIWQRALKAPLGGSETLSSMVVVLVFMLGLGIGAEMMGRRSRQIANPLKALGLVELLLAVANLLVMLVLKLGLADHAYEVQKFMMSVGVPLRLLYGVSAFAILIVPTFLMGATLPLASDACQRSQREENSH